MPAARLFTPARECTHLGPRATEWPSCRACALWHHRAAVRFSDFACIGRGQIGNVHGGAIETALDEATAECAKTKLFPLATTHSIQFQLKKAVLPHTTYAIKCSVEKESIKDIKYDVSGKMYAIDAQGVAIEKEPVAVCTAVLINPPKL